MRSRLAYPLPGRRLRQSLGFLLLTGVVVAGCSKRGETVGAVSDTASESIGARTVSAGDGDELGERNYRSVAEKVVNQSARVKEGDIVLINGSEADLPLLEDLSIEVQKRGAFPLVTLASSGYARRSYDEVPARYDSVTPKAFLKLAGMIDVYLGTESFEAASLKGVPAERLAARGKAGSPIGALMQKRGVRGVYLGNGLYPSTTNAQQYDVSRNDLADMLYSGVDVDYGRLQQTGEQVRQALASGKQVRITAPNGTDLRVGITGRPVFVSDGIISPEDVRRGGPATSVWLPAGEVYVVPDAGTAEGVVVADRDFILGEPIEGLRLEFKAGKLASMTAKSGLEPLKAQYDAAGQGRDVLGVVDLGINPGLKLPDNNKSILPWSRAGMVTVSVGNNTWAGGTNTATFGVAPHLPDATVTVDGKVLIKDGKLQAGESVASR
jgi:aminopeptidase